MFSLLALFLVFVYPLGSWRHMLYKNPNNLSDLRDVDCRMHKPVIRDVTGPVPPVESIRDNRINLVMLVFIHIFQASSYLYIFAMGLKFVHKPTFVHPLLTWIVPLAAPTIFILTAVLIVPDVHRYCDVAVETYKQLGNYQLTETKENGYALFLLSGISGILAILTYWLAVLLVRKQISKHPEDAAYISI